MNLMEFEKILATGEGVTVEFKRCGGCPEADTFESICSFANHAGGNVFLGVEDNGEVSGVAEKASLNIQRNISNVINNPDLFRPAVTAEFDPFIYGGKLVIRIWVPTDAFVHSFKNVIYDRSVDNDIKLKLDAQISNLYLRKQSSYTEQAIYPYVEKTDLELELLKDVRKQANAKQEGHPWVHMDDDELLRSAGLFAKSYATNQEGFNLAAVLLLGRDEVISSILPAYKTDAILRASNKDRYDDRLVVRCNLIKAYGLLDDFCKRHLNDRFFIEDGRSVSPRDIIVREIISNTLIHREYSSPFPAKVVISDDEILIENGSKAIFDGPLDLTSFNPMPKNPVIARFFNNIGRADELGSGSKNLLKYVKAYSGGVPLLVEGNVFKTSVPIVEKKEKVAINPSVERIVERMLVDKGYVTTVDVRDGLGIEHKAAQRELAKLVANGVIYPVGNTRARRYLPSA